MEVSNFSRKLEETISVESVLNASNFIKIIFILIRCFHSPWQTRPLPLMKATGSIYFIIGIFEFLTSKFSNFEYFKYWSISNIKCQKSEFWDWNQIFEPSEVQMSRIFSNSDKIKLLIKRNLAIKASVASGEPMFWTFYARNLWL